MKAITRIVLFVLTFFALTASVFAQTVAPATPSTGSALTALLSNGEFWTTAFGVVSALVAIWRHNAANAAGAQLTTAQKINQSLVLGIETATQIPQVKAFEDQIKATVQAKATEYGVQPLLHKIVQDLTEPSAASGGSTDSHT